MQHDEGGNRIRNVVLPITRGGASEGSSERQRQDYKHGINHVGETHVHCQDHGWAEAHMTFTLDNADGVKFPHTDALVIVVNIVDIEVRRVLVNGGSFPDLLFMHAFDQLRIL